MCRIAQRRNIQRFHPPRSVSLKKGVGPSRLSGVRDPLFRAKWSSYSFLSPSNLKSSHETVSSTAQREDVCLAKRIDMSSFSIQSACLYIVHRSEYQWERLTPTLGNSSA
jgi:hypothetical protein